MMTSLYFKEYEKWNRDINLPFEQSERYPYIEKEHGDFIPQGNAAYRYQLVLENGAFIMQNVDQGV